MKRNRMPLAEGPDAPTLAQHKELLEQIESGRMTKRKMQWALRIGNRMWRYDLASAILDEFFITPEEIADFFKPYGLEYSKEQLDLLVCSLPRPEILGRCRSSKYDDTVEYALLPGPPQPMSLNELLNFNDQSGGERFDFQMWRKIWFEDESEKFAFDEKIGPKWIAVRIYPDDSRIEEVPSYSYVLTAVEVAWAMLIFKRMRDQYLIHERIVQTSSKSASGKTVTIGTNGFQSGIVIHEDLYPRCGFAESLILLDYA